MKHSLILFGVSALLTCGMFASCDKVDPDGVNDNTPVKSSTPTSLSFSDKNDPAGTVWLNIDNHQYRIKTGAYEIYIEWQAPDNLRVEGGYSLDSRDVMMVRYGKVTGLNDINTSSIPEDGWASIMSCEPGYGYIVRYYQYNDSSHRSPYYYGLCVVGHLYGVETGGIIGAKIKYCPFSPEGGWNE